MKSLLVSILFFCGISSSAQTYHPLIRTNTYWDIMDGDATQICNFISGHRFFFQDDSTINGLQYETLQAYSIISLLPTPYCHPYAVDGSSFYPFRFMREDTVAKRVYIYNQWNNMDELLYDFSLNVGDTLDSLYNLGPTQIVITNIDTIVLNNGQIRKRYNHSLATSDFGLYCESLGGNQGICFPLMPPISNFEQTDCILENNVSIYGFGGLNGNGCFGFVGISEYTPIEQNIIISYNTTSHSTTITAPSLKGKNYLLRLFDLMGNVVFKEEGSLAAGYFSRDIKMEGLARGLYIASVQTEEMEFVGKLVR